MCYCPGFHLIVFFCYTWTIWLSLVLVGCYWCKLDSSGRQTGFGPDNGSQGTACFSPLLAVPWVGLNIPGVLQASLGRDLGWSSGNTVKLTFVGFASDVVIGQGNGMEKANLNLPGASKAPLGRQLELMGQCAAHLCFWYFLNLVPTWSLPELSHSTEQQHWTAALRAHQREAFQFAQPKNRGEDVLCFSVTGEGTSW